jgi:hypothetical protein
MSERDMMYEVSIGSDYAVHFARDRYCARVPLDRARMARVVDFLNEQNAPYAAGRREFEWSVLRNNCAHLYHNALAAAGVWPRWDTDRPLLASAFDFPVPKNEFVNLMRRTNDLPLGDAAALYRDETARTALLQEDWLPSRPGGIAEFAAAIADNEVYDTDLHLIFYDDPIFGDYRPHFRQILAERRYTDLAANLSYFASLYRHLRETEKNASVEPEAERSTDLARFTARLRHYVDRESTKVNATLAAIRPSSL